MRDLWRRAVAAMKFSLPGLILLLALACGSAAAPVTSTPRVSAGTPVADGIAQTSAQAATPTPPHTPKATSEKAGEIQATVDDSKDTSESVPGSGGSGSGGEAASNPRNDATSEDNQAAPAQDKGELRYPNLGSRLDELVASVEAGEITAEQAAGENAMHSGASVAVTFHLSGDVDGVVAFLEENGGDPRNVGEDYIEAYVPVALLGPASELPGVLRVREIVPPERGQGG